MSESIPYEVKGGGWALQFLADLQNAEAADAEAEEEAADES